MGFTWTKSLTGIVRYEVLSEIRTNVDWIHNNLETCTSDNSSADTTADGSNLTTYYISDNSSKNSSDIWEQCIANIPYCPGANSPHDTTV